MITRAAETAKGILAFEAGSSCQRKYQKTGGRSARNQTLDSSLSSLQNKFEALSDEYTTVQLEKMTLLDKAIESDRKCETLKAAFEKSELIQNELDKEVCVWKSAASTSEEKLTIREKQHIAAKTRESRTAIQTRRYDKSIS